MSLDNPKVSSFWIPSPTFIDDFGTKLDARLVSIVPVVGVKLCVPMLEQ